MAWFNDLRLGVRLGIAFGALVLALAVSTAVGIRGLAKVDAGADAIGGNDVPAYQALVTASEDFTLSAYGLLGHLYVYDGDLGEQDKAAKAMDARQAELDEALATLRPLLRTTQTRAKLREFTRDAKTLRAELRRAVALSRAETIAGVEERTGSRTAYLERVVPALERVDGVHDELEQALTDQAKEQVEAANGAYASSRRTLLVVGAAALAAGLVLALLVLRSVTGPVGVLVQRMRSADEHEIGSLRDALRSLADGDLTVEVTTVTEAVPNPSKDELGQATATLNAMLGKTAEAVVEYNAARGQLARLVGEVASNATVVSTASQQMTRTSDEAGRAVGEIAHAVADVAQGAERQVQMVESVRTTAEEAAQAATSSSDTALEAAQVAAQARAVAREGVEAAGLATDAMGAVRGSSDSVSGVIAELASKSDQIGTIVDTITTIAGQTNLLALNAAIEAARAGEQGRGFAVVAEEVRQLAEESQTAAGSIASLIGEIQAESQRAVAAVEDGSRQTAEGAATVERTRAAFERIETAVEDMTGRIERIASVSQQIAAGAARMQHDVAEVASVAEQSSASSEQVSASTQQTSASAQEVSASAQELAGTAQALEDLVRRFKVTAV